MCDNITITMLKPGVLLVLCLSSAAGTDTCEMSATRISCTSMGTSTLLSRYSTEQDNTFGVTADAIRQFIPHVRSHQCRKQLLTLADALTKSSPWAVQMVEASAKTVESDGYHLGRFDECIDVNVTRNGGSISGKYCLAHVTEYGGSGRSRMGICVPNGCRHGDVQSILERYLPEVTKHDVGVRVPEDVCVAKKTTRETTGYKLFKYGVLGLAFWCVFVTVLDLVTTNRKGSSETWRKTVGVFSCYRNILKLTSGSTERGVSRIHFMRVAAIFAIILYQRHRLMVEGPVKNRSYLQKVSVSPWPIFDTLIFLTGFLTVERLQNETPPDTKRKCFLLCLARWLRMMPLYGAVIAFYVVSFGDIGNGPLWVERIGRESRPCQHFWWANLSLVNNYTSATGQCIAQSWYLAVTSHGFVVTLIFMHLKRGKAFVGLGSLAVSVTTSLVLFLWNDYALHSQEPSTFGDLYIKTQYRLPSFVFGALSALLHHHLRQYKDKTTWVHFLTPFMLAIFGVVSILCHGLDEGSKMLFAVVSSLTWSVFISCVILIFPLYNISFSNSKLLQRIFISLSRLSYPALLSHNVVQLYLIGTMRTSEFVTLPRLAWMGAADIFASYTSALLLYLLIDGPVISAIKMAFCLIKGKEVNKTTEEPPEKS